VDLGKMALRERFCIHVKRNECRPVYSNVTTHAILATLRTRGYDREIKHWRGFAGIFGLEGA
jgi:hypothetical protein